MYSDKYTVVSIYPIECKESKPGIYPGYFVLPKSDKKYTPQTLIVGNSISYYTNWETKPPQTMEVPHLAKVIAESIVGDIRNSTFPQPNCYPGIACIPGEFTGNDIINKQEEFLDNLILKQKEWFKVIVALANAMWERVKQPQAIAEIQRIAADHLGMDVPWLLENQIRDSKCPACMAFLEPGVVVCRNCRCVIDKEGYAKLEFAKI